MKTQRPLMKTLAVFLALLLFLPQIAAAQGTDEAKLFKPEELEQVVAPVALYPDSLLSQILMASTYPLEVVQVACWAKQNENLEGDALSAELEKQDWDPSVKSLVNFPQVLQMMNEKLDWTAKLGDAWGYAWGHCNWHGGDVNVNVNHDGVVYQKDLGKNTEKTAQAMKVFNPDPKWKKVEKVSP